MIFLSARNSRKEPKMNTFNSTREGDKVTATATNGETLGAWNYAHGEGWTVDGRNFIATATDVTTAYNAWLGAVNEIAGMAGGKG
jgi:hypothetical protein